MKYISTCTYNAHILSSLALVADDNEALSAVAWWWSLSASSASWLYVRNIEPPMLWEDAPVLSEKWKLGLKQSFSSRFLGRKFIGINLHNFSHWFLLTHQKTLKGNLYSMNALIQLGTLPFEWPHKHIIIIYSVQAMSFDFAKIKVSVHIPKILCVAAKNLSLESMVLRWCLLADRDGSDIIA